MVCAEIVATEVISELLNFALDAKNIKRLGA
jgi:hypothetical protein